MLPRMRAFFGCSPKVGTGKSQKRINLHCTDKKGVTVPETVIISEISSLKGLGVLREHRANANTPNLLRYNLIYGFNGSGKTTLSRVFASLEAGVIDPALPPEGFFRVTLSDGNTMKSGGTLDALKARILVFNEDFLEKNLQWNEGKANPVLILGKENIDSVKELNESETRLKEIANRHQKVHDEVKYFSSRLVDFKRQHAREISVALKLGRKYEAPNLQIDYAEKFYNDEYLLSEEELDKLQSVFNRDAPLQKCNQIDVRECSLGPLVQDVRNVLSTTIGTIAIDELRQHDLMVKWVREGLDYHQTHGLEHCLFCGSVLKEVRKAALATAINGRYDSLTYEIGHLMERAADLRHQISAVRGCIPSINDISDEYRASFGQAAEKLKLKCSEALNSLQQINQLLQEKQKAPNLVIDEKTAISDAMAEKWDCEFIDNVSLINSLISNHNYMHDEFASVQETAKKSIKGHLLAEGQMLYTEYLTKLSNKETEFGQVEERSITIQKKIESLRQKISEHGTAANQINRLIQNYLGHRELTLKTHDGGYQICRSGKPIRGSLSEGEKTAIALCYFLTTLEAEGRKLSDLIIVVDDPVSSLDTRALNYAFSLLKARLANAAQVIILTHNLHFMNEVKKWFKKKMGTHERPDSAALYFLDTMQEPESDTRATTIVKMPTHIRDYESEYHYLFHLVLQFLNAADGEATYFYVMPNALRKVLEIFLAFKMPGSDGLTSKIQAVSQQNLGDLDPARIHALERLAQVESHADNLDDLVTNSSMIVEEMRDAAKALLKLMEVLDTSHYRRMCHICRT